MGRRRSIRRSKRVKSLLILWLASRLAKKRRQTTRSIWVHPILHDEDNRGNTTFARRSLYALDRTFHRHLNLLTASINDSSSPILEFLASMLHFLLISFSTLCVITDVKIFGNLIGGMLVNATLTMLEYNYFLSSITLRSQRWTDSQYDTWDAHDTALAMLEPASYCKPGLT